MEFACDIIESQVIGALISDPHSDWGNVFTRLIGNVTRMQRRRGGQGEKGVRWAARRIIFTFNTIYDIAPGVRPNEKHPIWDFMTLARTSPAIGEADVPPILEDYMSAASAPDWLVAAAHLGMAKQDAREVLVTTGTPLPWPGKEQPPLTGFEVEDVPELDKLSTEEDEIIYDVTTTPEKDEPSNRPPPFP